MYGKKFSPHHLTTRSPISDMNIMPLESNPTCTFKFHITNNINMAVMLNYEMGAIPSPFMASEILYGD
jgi:hypothetical protein